MKIEPQSTPDLVRLGELIANRPLAMLTSVGDDGALVSCPMEALEMDAEGALWFFTDLRLDLAERLRVVNLSFADDARGTYVSISGRGEIAKDPVRIQRLWTLFDRAAFPEGPSSRHLALLKVVTEKAGTGMRPQPDRPPVHARRRRRRHADRPGRSRRPDRPVRAAAVERRRRSMRNPLAAWRAGVRWPLATLGLVAAMVVAILACESIGWPFLVSPVQRWLASALDRRIEFNDEAGGQSGVRVGLLGGVRVTAQRIEVGAPAWSKEPHTLLARDVRLHLGYLDLWRAWRGELAAGSGPSKRAGARRRPRAPRRRPSLVAVRGNAPPATSDEGLTSLPGFAKLHVGKGRLTYADEVEFRPRSRPTSP